MPDAEEEELDELGDHPGVHFSFLFANWDPIALSKNPGEEGLEDADCLVAVFAGASDFLANWAPTAPSKKPGEEGLLEEGLLEEEGLEEG